MREILSKVLITGGAGFIGSNLVEFLIPYAEKIVIIDDLSNSDLKNLSNILNNEIEFIKLDITDRQNLEKVFSAQEFSIVFHQAALTNIKESFDKPIEYNNVNVNGSLNLLTLASQYGVKKIVYASSASVYGNNCKTPIEESCTPNPISPYAVSKMTLEQYFQVFNDYNNLETIGLRYFNVFGPKQNPNMHYSGVIPIFIKAALQGENLIVHGDGSQTRDFIYVDDVCQANINAALVNKSDKNILNIASGKIISIKEIADIIIEKTKSNSKIMYEKSRIGDIKESLADISLAKEAINFETKIDFEEGIERSIVYYRKLYKNK